MATLFDRKYILAIGSGTEEVIIQDLQVSFSMSKSANNRNKVDKCTLEITNLSPDSIKAIGKEYKRVRFGAGYKDEVVNLFAGEIIEYVNEKDGTDIVTKLTISPSFSSLNHKTLRTVVPGGKTVKDVINEILKNMPEVSKGVFKGTNINRQVLYGYPLSSSPRVALDEIADAFQLDWRVDQETLYVNDEIGAINDTNSAFLISNESGMVDAPHNEYKTQGKSKEDKTKKRGVRVKTLLNGHIRPGIFVKIQHKEFDKFYKVEEVTHSGDYRGSDWVTDVFCVDIS